MNPELNQGIEQLRRQIRKRKQFDRTFGLAGGALIALALLVLLALVANLVKDGAGALAQTHEAKADRSGFGRRELVGTLQQRGDGGWALLPDQWRVAAAPVNAEPVLGQRVAIEGRLPRGVERQMAATRIVSLPDGAPASGVAGILRQPDTAISGDADGTTGDRSYDFVPEPLALELGPNIDPARLVAGGRVSVDLERQPAGGVAAASAIVPLVAKGFFNSFPSREPREAGILSAWVGTLLIMIVTMALSVPLGVAAGVYLEEYAPRNRLTAIIEVNIANLAGVPSIIWGLMALGLFVYMFGFGRSILTAGMTLGLLVLPIVIIATREAIRAIPSTIREAAIGLGATRWQTTRYHIIPYSMSGILTGSIIALSRAIGETAPLVTIGALTFIAFLPPPPIDWKVAEADRVAHQQAVATGQNTSTTPPAPTLHVQPFAWLGSSFTVLPIQLFQWVSRPQKEFHANAAAAGVVLLALTLAMNGAAIYVRYRLRKKIKW